MPRSQNGWAASPDLKRRKLVVSGVEFLGGIVDNDDVATVLGYVAEQFYERVEPLHNPGCWGFYYRANRNDPNSLSNHSSGTAIDVNAPRHPNGRPAADTFTKAQFATIHKILAEVDHVVRWGGDYHATDTKPAGYDGMHFEINASRAAVAKVAAGLRVPAKPIVTSKRSRRPEVAAALVALRKVRDTAKTLRGKRRAQESIENVQRDFPGSGQ